MEDLVLLNSILTDIGNLVLVIFGFSVTLFTVLYSFILSKREQLKEYSDRLKSGSTGILVYQRHANAKRFIRKLSKFNRHLIVAIFLDFIVYLVCILTKYIVADIRLKEIITELISAVSIVIVIYIMIMLVVTVRDYLNITKIK